MKGRKGNVGKGKERKDGQGRTRDKRKASIKTWKFGRIMTKHILTI